MLIDGAAIRGPTRKNKEEAEKKATDRLKIIDEMTIFGGANAQSVVPLHPIEPGH